jgi:hypothetical protein
MITRIKKFVCLDEYSYLGTKQVFDKNKYFEGKINSNRKKVTIRYRNCTISKLYFCWTKYCLDNNLSYCASTQFRKVIENLKIIKKPKKKSDMCAICVDGQKAKRQITSETNEYRIELLNEKISLYERHVNDYTHQRNEFNSQKDNVSTHEVILVMDFKENIKINVLHDAQIGSEYFNPPQRSVFEIVMFYLEKGKSEKYYFDIVSTCLTHDSYFVINSIRACFAQPEYKNHKFNNVKLWMDNCPNQFKTRELFAFFSEQKQFMKFEWNFFIEYHGKNPCDTRFSQISTMLHDYNMDQNNERITTSVQVVKVIREQQIVHNEWRKESGKPPIISFQILLKLTKAPRYKKTLNIKHFLFLHSFKLNKEKDEVWGFLLTNDTKYSQVWKKEFTYIERKKIDLKQGTNVNENEISENLWDTVKKKFTKIDNFKINHKSPEIDTALPYFTNEWENIKNRERDIEQIEIEISGDDEIDLDEEITEQFELPVPTTQIDLNDDDESSITEEFFDSDIDLNNEGIFSIYL